MPRSEKDTHQPIRTEDPPQFRETKKGNQHDEEQQCETQTFLPRSGTQYCHAFVKRLAVKRADSRVLDNFETSEQPEQRHMQQQGLG
jgi:hypothetical protein